jgi:hypothetical protein
MIENSLSHFKTHAKLLHPGCHRPAEKDANAPLAAAAMFRRALQVITRDLLGAKPGLRN